jgi:outer membrane protein OmpA-like peptidoglycan-associated protein
MMRVLRSILIVSAWLIAFQADAQHVSGQSSNRRAQRAFDRALVAYHAADYTRVLEETGKALSRDPVFLNALILRGEVLYAINQPDESLELFETIVSINDTIYPMAYFYMGALRLKSGIYKEAKQSLDKFLSLDGIRQDMTERARQHLATCHFAIRAIENPVPFNPENLGPGVNSKDAEYSPSLTADRQTLVFTRRSLPLDIADPYRGSEVENFFISHYDGTRWTDARDMGAPLNTSGNEGAQSLSADGRELFFTACNRADGMGSCDIYYSLRTGTRWSPPINLGAGINSPYWDSQPSVSSDGKKLYFSSARPGSYGNMDIWVATRDDKGQWGNVQNLGPVINTAGRELSPFIHPDNQTLYFASDGHAGMGGLDLFYSTLDEQGAWSKPENLGYPVNTHADEFSLVVAASGDKAYFATDKAGGYGDMDIYEFELYEQVRPQPMTYIKGIVFDKETKDAVAASFELIDLISGITLHHASSDPLLGEFLVVVPLNRAMALNVSSPGYLFFSEHFSVDNARDINDPYLMDVPMLAVRSGESVVLRNVFFDTDSYQLKPESEAELGKLAGFLERNSTIRIEISGHTDNVGTYDYNLVLSENRAKSVSDYLIEMGIQKDRITYKGYADTSPVDTNDTEEGRANNRRTEFRIIDQ